MRFFANTVAEIGVECERWVARLPLGTGTGAGISVESKRSWTGVLVQHTLTLAELGIEGVAQRTLLVGTLALAASSAKVLATWTASHLATLSTSLSQLKFISTDTEFHVTQSVTTYRSNGNQEE